MRSVFASPRLLDYRAFGAYGEKAAHNAARRRRIQILMKDCGCDRPMVIIVVSKAAFKRVSKLSLWQNLGAFRKISPRALSTSRVEKLPLRMGRSYMAMTACDV